MYCLIRATRKLHRVIFNTVVKVPLFTGIIRTPNVFMLTSSFLRDFAFSSAHSFQPFFLFYLATLLEEFCLSLFCVFGWLVCALAFWVWALAVDFAWGLGWVDSLRYKFEGLAFEYRMSSSVCLESESTQTDCGLHASEVLSTDSAIEDDGEDDLEDTGMVQRISKRMAFFNGVESLFLLG